MNFNSVLTWVKQNVFVVVLGVVILGAAIGGPIMASKMSEGVEQRLSDRAKKFSELSALEKTQVTNPTSNEVVTTVINQKLLERYRQVVEQQSRDAERIREMALAHNRKDFSLLLPQGWDSSVAYLFPAPEDPTVLEYWPRDFWAMLSAEYEMLIDRANAGLPPTPADIADDIQRADGQFRLTQLFKNREDELTVEEQAQLRDHLQQVRLGRYSEVAKAVSFYGSTEQLAIPSLNEMELPSLAEMFVWQWDQWIVRDILNALAAANDDSRNVLDAPVKRVVYLQVLDNPLSVQEEQSSSSAGPAGFGVNRGPKPPDASGAPALSANPKAPVPLDYNASFTGRQSNPLYDVRDVALGLIVDIDRLPEVMDSIAKQNFFTVIDMDIESADPFEDVREGFMYGSDPVMRVSMLIETVWLREWTTEYMPDDLKTALGIALPPSPPDAAAPMP